jgi:integral membrane protein
VASEPPTTVTAVPPRLTGALRRFRIAAYVVGVFLLLLVAAMVLKYGGDQPRMVQIVGPIHGFIYMVYLAIGLDLAMRAKWSIRGTLAVLLAGTIPFLSFVAERIVTRRMHAGQPL